MPDRKTVLILDDATQTAKMLADQLKEEGFNTNIETDLNAALTGLKKRKWPFDLVVFDFWYGRITGGYEIFGLLQKEYPSIPKILFTKARWAIPTTLTPDEDRALAAQQFAELENSSVRIVDKIGASPELDLGDAIDEVVKLTKTCLLTTGA